VSKLPVVTAKDLERVLYVAGFFTVRQKGSHVFYRHPDGRTTTVPHHKGHDIARPLLRSVLRDIKMDVDSFVVLLKKI